MNLSPDQILDHVCFVYEGNLGWEYSQEILLQQGEYAVTLVQKAIDLKLEQSNDEIFKNIQPLARLLSLLSQFEKSETLETLVSALIQIPLKNKNQRLLIQQPFFFLVSILKNRCEGFDAVVITMSLSKFMLSPRFKQELLFLADAIVEIAEHNPSMIPNDALVLMRSNSIYYLSAYHKILFTSHRKRLEAALKKELLLIPENISQSISNLPIFLDDLNYIVQRGHDDKE